MKTPIIRDYKKFGPVILALIILIHGCNIFKKENTDTIHFAILADIHKDIMHDADERLQVFIDSARKRNVDFIIQLGDFCWPHERNETFMGIWNSFERPKFHVLGNHDMDGGYTRDETVAYYGMPSRYYSFDKQGFHFVVLDGNDSTDPPQPGYAHFIGEEQKEWLVRDLAASRLPVVIFSHQCLSGEMNGVVNAEEIRKILEEQNHLSDNKKVIACFNGHNHLDGAMMINGIWYIEVNSMSNQWLGEEYLQVRYSKEIDKKYPLVKYTAPYKDPLFALVEIDYSKGIIRIKGRESTWVGPSPWELGFPGFPGTRREQIVPRITSQELKFKHKATNEKEFSR